MWPPATLSTADCRASRPHGQHQILQLLAVRCFLILPPRLLQVFKHIWGTHGYTCFATVMMIGCPSCLPVALSYAYIINIAVYYLGHIFTSPCSRTMVCSHRLSRTLGIVPESVDVFLLS